MFVMLTGQPPFYGNNDQEIIEKVKQGIYPRHGNYQLIIVILIL
jgi:hypothetical protein